MPVPDAFGIWSGCRCECRSWTRGRSSFCPLATRNAAARSKAWAPWELRRLPAGDGSLSLSNWRLRSAANCVPNRVEVSLAALVTMPQSDADGQGRPVPAVWFIRAQGAALLRDQAKPFLTHPISGPEARATVLCGPFWSHGMCMSVFADGSHLWRKPAAAATAMSQKGGDAYFARPTE